MILINKNLNKILKTALSFFIAAMLVHICNGVPVSYSLDTSPQINCDSSVSNELCQKWKNKILDKINELNQIYAQSFGELQTLQISIESKKEEQEYIPPPLLPNVFKVYLQENENEEAETIHLQNFIYELGRYYYYLTIINTLPNFSESFSVLQKYWDYEKQVLIKSKELEQQIALMHTLETKSEYNQARTVAESLSASIVGLQVAQKTLKKEYNETLGQFKEYERFWMDYFFITTTENYSLLETILKIQNLEPSVFTPLILDLYVSLNEGSATAEVKIQTLRSVQMGIIETIQLQFGKQIQYQLESEKLNQLRLILKQHLK